MHTYKIIAAMMASAVILAGCSGGGRSQDEVVESLKAELAETKAAQQELQKQYISQNEEMTEILKELNTITGKTASLRLDVENGSARLTQAEQISAKIDALKAKVSALEKSNAALSGKNKDFAKMVEEFNSVIETQEQQINALKEEIQGKDRTIRAQKDTISSQSSTIARQRDDLEKLVAKQAKSLCEAGEALEEIADNAPEVSWKKNRDKVASMAQSIYMKALDYYQLALEAGYAPAQERINAISGKIK